jgi:ferredoxin
VCPQELIHIDEGDIRGIPQYLGSRTGKDCIGCMRCVAICPGLAITLVDARKDAVHPIVTVPLEFGRDAVTPGSAVLALDTEGTPLGEFAVLEVLDLPNHDRTVLVRLQAPADVAPRIAGIRMQEPWIGEPLPEAVEPLHDHDIVCRCERVTAGEIRALIRAGHRDMNEIKALTRAGMGACGGKTCRMLLLRLFRECGVPEEEVVDTVPRPLFVEVPLSTLAGANSTGLAMPSRAGNQDDSPVGKVEHGW